MNARLGVVVALACSSIIAFDGSFEGNSWMLPALLSAIAPMALIRASRPFWKRSWVIALMLGASGIWYLVVTLVPTTTFYGLPTSRSMASLFTSAYEALVTMRTTVVPITPTVGHLSLLFASSWIGGAWSALNLKRHLVIAGGPWLITFTFAALIGMSQGRVAFSTLFMACSLAALYVWADPGSRAKGRGISMRGKAGTWTGLTALVVTLIVTPLFPGYGAPPLVQLGETTAAGGGRLTPFSELRSQLDEDRTVVMFTVRSSKEAYWRLTTLEMFDGRSWRIRGDFVDSRGDLSWVDVPKTNTVRLVQDFEINGLRGNWLPAAHLPASVEGVDVEVDTARHTLRVEGLSRGQQFRVSSNQPVPTLDEVRLADAGGANGLERFLQIPSSLALELGGMARAITADARSDYEQALAIQDYLRAFTYSLDVPSRHDARYILEFLTETQTGYCEQFAGSMALLLRSIGIPSRVAVGFLPGTQDEGKFTVTNHEAHAWTEAYFRGYGWLAFEPTPRSEADPPLHTRPPTAAAPAAPSSGPSAPPSPVARTQSLDREEEDLGAIENVPAGRDPAPIDVSRRAAAMALALLGGTALAMVAIKQIWVAWLMYRADSPDKKVSAAWERLMLHSQIAFRPFLPGETETEYLAALAQELGLDPKLFGPIRSTLLKSSYGPGSVGEQESLQAVDEGRSLERTVWHASGWWARLKIIASPAPWIRALTTAIPQILVFDR